MAEDRPASDAFGELLERLDHLERLLQANTARLYAVERRLGLEGEPARPLGEPAPPTAPPVNHDAQIPSSDFGADTANAASAPRPEARPAPEARPLEADATRPAPEREVEPTAEPVTVAAEPATTTPRDFESMIGGSWFNWAGILAVVFATAFSLKYAFERDWIGPGTRVSLGAAGGFGLLALAERLRGRGLRQYAYVMTGGGILILYLSIYAAHNFYQLIGQPAAFALMAGVTTGAVLLSVRHDALAVAVLGLVGGFLTPLLLSTGHDNQVGLFAYVALLDAGVLAVAYFKRWNLLNFLSFAATTLVTLGWLGVHYRQEKLWTTLFFVTLFFIIYALLAVVHNLLPRRRARWFDAALIGANASFHFGVAYALLVDEGYERRLPATVAVVVSAIFVLLFYAVWRWHRADRLLAYVYVAGAVTFFTIALGTQYELYWVTIAWAVEALMLTWAGMRANEPSARRAGLVVFALAALHWLVWDLPDSGFRVGADFAPLLNRRALSCAALVAALGGAAWLYRRAARGGEVGEEEGTAAASALTLAASALGLTLLTFDLDDYFERRRTLLGEGATPGRGDRLDNTRFFSLSALWAVYAAGLLAFGVRLGRRALRYAGVLLLAAATTVGVVGCLPFYAAPWHVPILNPTFAAFAVLVAIYIYAARLYGRGDALPVEERAMVPLLVVAANLLAVVALSAEASGYYEARIAEAAAGLPPHPELTGSFEEYEAALAERERVAGPVRDLGLAKQLSLSLVWALYGAGLLVAGRVRRVRLLRLMALALLGLTTLKVFFWDLASLDQAYRIVSFVALGLVLLAVSYFYQKSQQRAGEEEESRERVGEVRREG
jgi:uncharacterized membrane protein